MRLTVIIITYIFSFVGLIVVVAIIALSLMPDSQRDSDGEYDDQDFEKASTRYQWQLRLLYFLAGLIVIGSIISAYCYNL